MSSKIKSITVATALILLGLIYFAFGLNFFLHFIPTPTPPTEGPLAAFVGGLFQSGYFFPFLKGLEVILGLMLLTRLFVPLSLVVLTPVSLNIFLFHLFLSQEGMVMSVVILALQIYLLWSYRSYYNPLLTRKSVAA